MQYALYQSDPDLQLAHARFPWMVTWDDHEVQNDYANTQSQYEGDISALRAAAYQAWYEHQPVRRPARPAGEGPRIYRRLQWGDLAQFDVIDGRQYRSVPPCGWGEADACDGGYDPSITMLGQTPGDAGCYDGLRRSRRPVERAGQQRDARPARPRRHRGRPALARRVGRVPGRAATADRGVGPGERRRNPVVVTGDWHSTFVNDIHADFDRARTHRWWRPSSSAPRITSNGDGEVYGPYYGPMIKYNPHIKFFDGDRRGYVRCTIDRDEFRTDLQMVTTVSRADAPKYTYASFVVENGRPGAVKL